VKRPLEKAYRIFLLATFLLLGCTTLSHANSTTPFLGMQIQGLSPIIVKAIGLESDEGVLVRDIAYPGPTSSSDIRRGDVLVELDGKAASNVTAVEKIAASLKSGSKVRATVIRRGKRIDVSLKVGSKPPSWNVTRNNFATVAPLGITFAALTDKVQKRFDLGWRTRGVVVSLVDEEKAAGLDIKVGDVIVQVNQSPVWKPSHIIGYFKKAQKEKKEMVLLLVEGANGLRFTLLPVPQ